MSMNKVIQKSIQNTQVVNLLDNSNFLNPINQREETNYSGSGYVIDRWRTWDNDAMLSISNNGITINKNIWQYVNDKVDIDKTYTIATKTLDGVIDVCTGKFSDSIGTSRVWMITDPNNGYYCFCLGGGYTYEWAALYEGEFTKETLPNYQPKSYDDELRACQRYYYKNRSSTAPAAGFFFYTNSIKANYPLPVPMRKQPIADTTGIDLNKIDIYTSSGVVHPTNLVVNYYALNSVSITLQLDLASSVGTVNTPVSVRFNSIFSLSADF